MYYISLHIKSTDQPYDILITPQRADVGTDATPDEFETVIEHPGMHVWTLHVNSGLLKHTVCVLLHEFHPMCNFFAFVSCS